MSSQVMGVLNVTPDSFSDGGKWLDPHLAVTQGLKMAKEGASIIDVGGESTRPGARELSVDEEAARVVPVVSELTQRLAVDAIGARVSIDTRHKEVAVAATDAGATIINDVSAALHGVAAQQRCAWIAMHMAGSPQTMQDNPHYEDVVAEVASYLSEVATKAQKDGVDEVYIDPGIGFGKNVEHNCKLLAAIGNLCETGFPVVVGTSRKSFIGRLSAGIVDSKDATQRLGGSVSSAVVASLNGASIVRVHDVKETVQALRVAEAIATAAPQARQVEVVSQ